jgi:hypothetical protein
MDHLLLITKKFLSFRDFQWKLIFSFVYISNKKEFDKIIWINEYKIIMGEINESSIYRY